MPRSSSPPNVLLVIADDHRADAIGAFGHPVVRTPVLDALVRRGAAFTQARIMGGLMPAVCAPSRACLLTGRDVFRADAAPRLDRGPDFEVRLPPDACTLPERFRAAGYETFFTGKWHNDLPALQRSFEVAHNIFKGGMCDHTAVPVHDLAEIAAGAPPRLVPGFSTEIFCETAEAFLQKRKHGRPFFACVALTSPHDPRTPPPEYRALYDPAEIPLPNNFLPEHPFDNGELDVRDEQLAPKPRPPAVLREQLADYYGMISHHDAWLGRVFEALRETDEADNTLVVYISDHGLALGSHGLLGKQNLYEPSVRVPFIVAGPGVPRDVRIATPAYSLDLYATLCALAGITPPDGLESRSLVPAFASSAARVRETTCAAYMDGQRMATDGRWKLIVYHVAGTERVQLFDLVADSGEQNNLADETEHAPQIARLRGVLGRWQQRVGDRWWVEIPSGVIA
ncbi:MAG: sulfatase-like hydrolase/transferase [Opitutaceae bacterium]